MYAVGLALAAAAVATAMPTEQSISATEPVSKPFGVAMLVNDKYYSINVVANSSAESLVLLALPINVYPGTLAFYNGTSNNASLGFEINGAQYGAVVPDVGDNYGLAVDVDALKGFHDYHFSVINGTIEHALAAGLNSFLGCQRDVNGQSALVLSWGDYNSNGSAPYECVAASLYQNCGFGTSKPVRCS